MVVSWRVPGRPWARWHGTTDHRPRTSPASALAGGRQACTPRGRALHSTSQSLPVPGGTRAASGWAPASGASWPWRKSMGCGATSQATVSVQPSSTVLPRAACAPPPCLSGPRRLEPCCCRHQPAAHAVVPLTPTVAPLACRSQPKAVPRCTWRATAIAPRPSCLPSLSTVRGPAGRRVPGLCMLEQM